MLDGGDKLRGVRRLRAVFGIIAVVALAAALLCGVVLAGHRTEDPEYIILGANDLGMHCMQDDYSVFMLLPPANTVRVQVFKRGKNVPVTDGITVTYAYPNRRKNPSDQSNFWRYAAQYGFPNLSPGQGISGNFLNGTMTPDPGAGCFRAEYVPVLPRNTCGKPDPFPLMTVTAKDRKTGKLLAVSQIVTPVSDELLCDRCHGKTKTDENILQAHDKNAQTHLYQDYLAGQRHACAECHKDNALSRPGVPGRKPLSQAMHGSHAPFVYGLPPEQQLSVEECYFCHPGPVTLCNRGVMSRVNLGCCDCHGGDMYAVADSQTQGREAWLQEPSCANCHSAVFAPNPNTLYRNSRLVDSPVAKMNGHLFCETCHGSPHAEWPSREAADNRLPSDAQGYAHAIMYCRVCHTENLVGRIHAQ